jgi:hypothetical protein
MNMLFFIFIDFYVFLDFYVETLPKISLWKKLNTQWNQACTYKFHKKQMSTHNKIHSLKITSTKIII